MSELLELSWLYKFSLVKCPQDVFRSISQIRFSISDWLKLSRTDKGLHRCRWRVRHQHQISVTDITFWRIMMLVTDVSPSGFVYRYLKVHWIWHQVEFHVYNITYRSPTWHSGIFWFWWPIEMSPTCRKMSSTSFFVTKILKYQHKVTNITMSETSLSPLFCVKMTFLWSRKILKHLILLRVYSLFNK